MQTLRSGQEVPAICAAAELSPEALEMLATTAEARLFVERLAETEAWSDAISFLAHALPRREAVWWAWLCARDSGEGTEPTHAAALEATKAWVAEPTDDRRQAALSAAQVVGIATPAGMAGLAVFLCGDTLGPPTSPPAPPPEFAAAKVIAGCITIAAVADPKAGIPERYAELVRRGLELADRISLWTPDTAATARKA